jgi:uncharacterized protein YuzE
MGLTHYRLSSHGLQEMARRGILRQVVVDILAQPEQVVPGRDNRTIYQSRWDSEEGKTYLVRVVVDEQIDPPVVITVYRTSKVQKYLEGGMKIVYDPAVDVLRILFQEVPIAESDEDESGIIFDYDAAGNVVGLEVLSASKRVDNPQSMSYVIETAKTAS